MTRYAVVADVHANLPALRAVRSALSHEDVTEVLCLGDVVGYGAAPDACIDLLQELGARCVAGNHDLVAVDRLDHARLSPLARDSLDWTRRVLSPGSRAWLEALPASCELDGMLLAHGSPGDPEEYVTTGGRAVELLSALPPSVRLLLLGHTHHQWVVGDDGDVRLRRRDGTVCLDGRSRYLVNPGSVGQSRNRDLLARFLVLDTGTGTADFRAIRYDVGAAADAMRAVGLSLRGLSPVEVLPVRAVKSARRRARVAVGSALRTRRG